MKEMINNDLSSSMYFSLEVMWIVMFLDREKLDEGTLSYIIDPICMEAPTKRLLLKSSKGYPIDNLNLGIIL